MAQAPEQLANMSSQLTSIVPVSTTVQPKRRYKMEVIRRARLTSEQQAILQQEYEKNPDWRTRFITQLASRLNICRTKVYKWGWDRRKKEL